MQFIKKYFVKKILLHEFSVNISSNELGTNVVVVVCGVMKTIQKIY